MMTALSVGATRPQQEPKIRGTTAPTMSSAPAPSSSSGPLRRSLSVLATPVMAAATWAPGGGPAGAAAAGGAAAAAAGRRRRGWLGAAAVAVGRGWRVAWERPAVACGAARHGLARGLIDLGRSDAARERVVFRGSVIGLTSGSWNDAGGAPVPPPAASDPTRTGVQGAPAARR